MTPQLICVLYLCTDVFTRFCGIKDFLHRVPFESSLQSSVGIDLLV